MITTRSSLLDGADDAQRMVSVFGGVLCLGLEFSSLWGRHGGMTTITVIIIMIIIVIIIIIIIQKRHHPCHGEEGGGRHRQIRARRNFREGSETSRLSLISQKKYYISRLGTSWDAGLARDLHPTFMRERF